MMRKKVFLTTLGCKVNQFESAAFGSEFQQRGLELADAAEAADIIVINTCAVTAKASSQSRQEIRKAVRKNPAAAIVVTGCHAQLAAADIAAEEDIPADRLRLVGNDRKDRLVSEILAPDCGGLRLPADMSTATEISRLRISRFTGRTRAFLRVQDGCNACCSYCIVPHTRGRSRSLPPEEVVEQAGRFRDAGHREIVVTGIHVGLYGADLAVPVSISSLMENLCTRFSDLRFRLSSIEPFEIDAGLLTLMRDRPNFMPHLHIPLQSGDNEILARMNRRYRREAFIEVIARCREARPDAAIGIDVLVGFPGEREEHFANTRELLERVDCTYLHVFPYSRRPGTLAAAFEGHSDKATKQRRVEVLRDLSETKRLSFYRRHIGTCRDVLVESERDRAGRLKGLTDNYIPVVLDADNAAGPVLPVRLESIAGGVVHGSIVSGL